MAKGNELKNAIRTIQIIIALLGFVFMMVKFLLFSKSNLGALLSFLVLVAVLWGVREVMPPEIHVCDACGLEYSYSDFAGHFSHYYCAKSPSHEHDGPKLKGFDVHRGVAQLIAWMNSDLESLKRVFAKEEQMSMDSLQASQGNND